MVDKNIKIEVISTISFDGHDPDEGDFYAEFEVGDDLAIHLKNGKDVMGDIVAIGPDYIYLRDEGRDQRVDFKDILGFDAY